MKIIEKLSTYAALIGVIGAIGGGFYTWGQFNTRLDAMEKSPSVNLRPLHEKDKELEKQFDSVLLYANEYKVDLIDRIAKVEEKIKPQDLTGLLKSIQEVREKVAGLKIPAKTDLGPLNKSIKELEKKIADLGKSVNAKMADLNQSVAIVQKENELQDILMEEIKASTSNPLGG
jgi:hypothetical protein